MSKTAVELLEAGDLSGALDMMERLRAEVPMQLGDEIPWERLPLLPLGEKLSRFTAALKRFDITDQALTRRLEALRPWLVNLKILPGSLPAE